MKKLIILCILLFPVMALASPFIVTPPVPFGEPRADYYKVCFNRNRGVSYCYNNYVWNNNGVTSLAFDVDYFDVPDGTYRVTIQGFNADGPGLVISVGTIKLPYTIDIPVPHIQWKAPWDE